MEPSQLCQIEPFARPPWFPSRGNKLCFDPNASYSPARPVVGAEAAEIRSYFTGLSRSPNSVTEIEIHFEANVCGDSSYSEIALSPANFSFTRHEHLLGGSLETFFFTWEPIPEDQLTFDKVSVSIREVQDPAASGRMSKIINGEYNGPDALIQTANADVASPGLRERMHTFVFVSDVIVPGQTYDLDEFAITIKPIKSISENGISYYIYGGGRVWCNEGWRAFNVLADGTSAQEMARDLGLSADENVFSWDAEEQRWNVHPTADEPSGALDQGTAVMFQGGVSAEEYIRDAGLGRADEDVVVTLHQAWNLLAPATATEDFTVDEGNPHIVFDDSLSDCRNLAGVLAIITYDSQYGEFKIALPCHPDLIPAGYEPLDAIDSRDSMWVFFQSQLPVPITWDVSSSSYGPA